MGILKQLLASRSWRKLRNDFIRANPTCALCGGTKKLEVHHILPRHLYPDLADSWENLIVLCESKSYGVTCHLFLGHWGSYRERFNPTVREDAAYLRAKIQT